MPTFNQLVRKGRQSVEETISNHIRKYAWR